MRRTSRASERTTSPRERRVLASVSLVLAGGLLAAAAVTGRAANWPMWGGTPARNMVNATERNMPTEWDVAKKQNIKWSAALGTKAYGNTVIADGKIFVGTNNGNPRNPKITGDKGVVMCFRQSNGALLWQAVHDKLRGGTANDFPEEGICSTCAVEGKRVYYVSNRCELVCADTEGFLDGKNDGVTDEKYNGKTDADIVWRLDMMAELGAYPHNMASSSPLVIGDLVYALTSNGVDNDHEALPAPDAPSFIAVNKLTGKVVWTDNSPGSRVFHGQWSSPTYGEVNGRAQVYMPGGDGWLYAFEPLGDPARPGKGKLIWKFDCNPPGAKFAPGARGTAGALVATPVFHDKKVFVGVGDDPGDGSGSIGHLWAIDATKTGDVSEQLGDWNATTRTKENARKNPNSAAVWHFGDKDFARTISSVAIQGDLVFAAELAGFVHCLDLKTGKPHWKHDTLAGIWGSPFIVDGKVYIGDEDGDVCIFEASREMKLINEIMMGQTVFSTAVAVDGVLYIATQRQLYAIEQK